MACKHVDGVALLDETIGKQRLSSGIGSADISVTEDGDKLVDNVVGVGLSEAVVRGASRLTTLPVTPAGGSGDGGGKSKRCKDAEELHLG